MKIEADEVTILSGVRYGRTLGSPITLQIINRDWERWRKVMAIEGLPPKEARVTIAGDEQLSAIKAEVTAPRPGHADLAGAFKCHQADLRNILERASARETAVRVAVGAVARKFLQEFGIDVFSGVIGIGGVVIDQPPSDLEVYREKVKQSLVAAPDEQASIAMMSLIDQAKKDGNSLGGLIEVIILGVPAGLGSYVHWDRRLDSRLSAALMSIPAIKAVEIGLGFKVATMFGSEVHDQIFCKPSGEIYRQSNNAGGIEGGISNGESIRLCLAMKPLPTLYQPLQTVDLATKIPVKA